MLLPPAHPWGGGTSSWGARPCGKKRLGRRKVGWVMGTCEQMAGVKPGMHFAWLRAAFSCSIAGCVLDYEPALKIFFFLVAVCAAPASRRGSRRSALLKA